MAKHVLEAQLAALTQEFVHKLVEVIRNASFADVAGLSAPKAIAPRRGAPSVAKGPSKVGKSNDGASRVRQTASRRAELAEQVMRALQGAGQPLGVRAISNELSVAPDLLAAPLRELRASGRIRKHGEKRATTYSAA